MTLYLPSHAHGSAGLELGLFRKPIHLLVCTHSQCKYISMDHNYNNIYYRVEMLEGNFPRAIINLIFFGQSQIYVIFYFQFHVELITVFFLSFGKTFNVTKLWSSIIWVILRLYPNGTLQRSNIMQEKDFHILIKFEECWIKVSQFSFLQNMWEPCCALIYVNLPKRIDCCVFQTLLPVTKNMNSEHPLFTEHLGAHVLWEVRKYIT